MSHDLPLVGADGPVVLVDARSAFLLRDGLRRWAAEQQRLGSGVRVANVAHVLRSVEVAADFWAGRLLDARMSAGGRADMVEEPSGAGSVEQLLTTAQTASALGLTARQVRRLAAAEELPGTRLGGAWMFRPDTVQAVREDRNRRSA